MTQKTMELGLWFVLLMAGLLGAETVEMPAVVDLTGGRIQQAGANFQAGEKIRPVGWSVDGKFAWITEHFVDGRGGTSFAYIIFNTIDDKVVARLDDDSENWEARQWQDDAQESWRRNRQRWGLLLKRHKIDPGSGLVFRALPLTLAKETYRVTLTLIPSPPGSDQIEFFPFTGFIVKAGHAKGSKQLASERKVPLSAAWVSGCFLSPLEGRMLVVVARESFVFEGTEFFYHFYGCKLDSGFKIEPPTPMSTR